MKFIPIIFISLNIWQLISSDTDVTGNSAGHEHVYHDQSSLMTSLGKKEQLAKCEIKTEYLLTQEAFCGACRDPVMLENFEKWTECTLKRAPHVAHASLEIRKKPLDVCKAELLALAANLSQHDPQALKDSEDCVRHIKKENLGKCSIQQFYNPALTVSCGESSDKVVNNELKKFAACISKNAPKHARELQRIQKNAKNVETCVVNQKAYGLKVLLGDEKAFVQIQACFTLMTLEVLHRHYVEKTMGRVTRFVCTPAKTPGCKDRAMEEEMKKSMACSNKKIPESVKFISELEKKDPETCYKRIIDYMIELSLDKPDSFQVVVDCHNVIDQSKM